MRSRTQFILVLSSIAALIILPASLVWAIDPLQVYRARANHPVDLQRLSRYQIAGLIRSYLADPDKEFDTIIIGTSLSQNFAPSQVKETLGSSGVLKMAMAGAHVPTQLLVAKRALQEPTLKRVIWELNDRSFALMPADKVNANHVFPAYLYQGGMALRKYLLNIDNVEECLRQLGIMTGSDEWRPQGDEWGSWYYSDEHWKKKQKKHKRNHFGAYRKALKQKVLLAFTTPEQLLQQHPPSARYSGIDQVASLVAQHPNVQFDFFIPPVSAAFYACKDPAELSIRFGMTRYAVKQLSHLPNARLFAFNDVEAIVCNLSLYRDIAHYHPDINRWILEAIEHNKHRLDSSNIDAYEQAWYYLIRAVRVTDLDTGT